MKSAATIAVAALLGGLSEGGMALFLLLAFAVYVVVPWLVVLSLFSLFAICRGRLTPEQTRHWRLLLGSVLPAMLAAYATGKTVHHYLEQGTRDYVARAVVVLDHINETTGSYPQQLPVSEIGPLPCWLHPRGYSSDGNSFCFTYEDPSGVMDAYSFTSEGRRWRHGG